MTKKRFTHRRKYLLVATAILILLLCWKQCICENAERQAVKEDGGTERVEVPDSTDKVVETDIVRHRMPKRVRHAMPTVPDVVQDSVVPADSTVPVDSIMEPQPDIVPEPEADTSIIVPDDTIPEVQRHFFRKNRLFRTGIRAGAGYSLITGMGSILENYNRQPTSTYTESGCIIPGIGIYGVWTHGYLGLETGIDFFKAKAITTVTQIRSGSDLVETTEFGQQFISPQLTLRFYPLPSCYIGAGIGAAVPILDGNIGFSSNRTGASAALQDQRTREHLQKTLRFTTLVTPLVKLGYSNPRGGLDLEVAYRYGVNDMMETLANDHGYQERMNNTHIVSLTIGYNFILNK